MWVKDYSPSVSDWFICVVDGKRLPLTYNAHNKFWCGLDGKTYKEGSVEWLDDSKVEKK